MNKTRPSTLAPLLPSEAALDRFVYLVGPVRGGTTLLHRAMNFNPRALVLPKVTHFLPNVWQYHDVVHERLLRQIIRLGPTWDQDSIEARLDKQQLADFRVVVGSAFASRKLDQLYKLLPIAHALSTSFAKPPADIVCWHDKSNDWRYLGAVSRAFPRARFIFLVRDPRSVVLSGASRMAIKAGELTPRLTSPNIVAMSLYWRLMAQRSLDFANRHPDRSRIVRYEDFIAAPAAILRELFVFASDEAPSVERIAQQLAELPGAATMDAKETYTGISSAPSERWRTAMTREQLELIAQLAGPTAKKLGYDIARPGGPAGLVGPFRSVLGAGSAMKNAAKLLLEEGYELMLSPPRRGTRIGASPSERQ